MASTVISAFVEFLNETVNLDPGVTKLARASRDWLVEQIHAFPDLIDDFPVLYAEKDIFFGSFARGTKIRELDDIDLMICLSAEGAYYTDYTDRTEITVPNLATRLHRFCYEPTDILNSRRIINRFVSALSQIAQYEKAEIKRTEEAATLKLKTYTWNFDIVPCFFTKEDVQGKTYYVIPDGKGHWKKTDPRKDRDAVSVVNRAHEGRVLNPIRVMKFWNRRPTAPAMPSYLLETILVTHYLFQAVGATCSYVDLEIPTLLQYISDAVISPVYDLKQIQGDINELTFLDKWKIQQRAKTDYVKAVEARNAENVGDYDKSLRKWGEIFGPMFPTFG
jgi:hypothetical protein